MPDQLPAQELLVGHLVTWPRLGILHKTHLFGTLHATCLLLHRLLHLPEVDIGCSICKLLSWLITWEGLESGGVGTEVLWGCFFSHECSTLPWGTALLRSLHTEMEREIIQPLAAMGLPSARCQLKVQWVGVWGRVPEVPEVSWESLGPAAALLLHGQERLVLGSVWRFHTFEVNVTLQANSPHPLSQHLALKGPGGKGRSGGPYEGWIAVRWHTTPLQLSGCGPTPRTPVFQHVLCSVVVREVQQVLCLGYKESWPNSPLHTVAQLCPVLLVWSYTNPLFSWCPASCTQEYSFTADGRCTSTGYIQGARGCFVSLCFSCQRGCSVTSAVWGLVILESCLTTLLFIGQDI